MNKKIYYLCGLPRTGKTLFGSILNQNPKIQATSNSIVLEMLWNLENLKKHGTFLNFPDHSSFENVMKNVIPNYYKDWNCEIILDRSAWGTPDNLKLLEKYSPNNIKFIVFVRNVENVVSSFIKWSIDNKPNFLDNETDGSIRSKCEYLMKNDSQIVQSYCSAYNIFKSGYPYYLIEYDKFIENPEDTLTGFYNFLEIEKFEHKLNNIEQFKCNEVSYDDSEVGKNLHTIRTDGISINEYDVNKYIPEDLLLYYSTLNFWK